MDATFPLRPRRLARALRAQTALHAVTALVLVVNGFDHIHSPHPLVVAMAICGFLAGTAMIVTVVLERLRPHHEDRSVAWVEVFSGFVVMVERLSVNVEGRHHTSFLIINTLGALMAGGTLIFLGLNREWAARRRAVIDDGRTLLFRLSKFRRFRVAWDDVRGFEAGTSTVLIRLENDGERAIHLDRFEDSPALSAWLIERFRLHSVPETTTDAD